MREMVQQMKTFPRLTFTAMLVASAFLVSGCGGHSETPSTAPAAAPTLSAGLVVKGVANDGTGDYLQTTIADSDPAMTYNPALADEAAKKHFSDADLAEAQKAAVKFIAEEAIDSTLNGGGNDVDVWYEAHKDVILPANQSTMLNDLKSGKGILAREEWMTKRTGYSYVHGADIPRVTERTITPKKLSFVEKNNLQGVKVSTEVNYSMPVIGGTHSKIQTTKGEVSFSVSKDPADGKWKIAGYNTAYHTTAG
jgi:hypothetical protein